MVSKVLGRWSNKVSTVLLPIFDLIKNFFQRLFIKLEIRDCHSGLKEEEAARHLCD